MLVFLYGMKTGYKDVQYGRGLKGCFRGFLNDFICKVSFANYVTLKIPFPPCHEFFYPSSSPKA